MPTTVDCPACRRELRVPDHLLDKQVRCPLCGEMFAATAQPERPPPSPQPETLAFPPGSPAIAPPSHDSLNVPPSAPSPVQEKFTTPPASPESERPNYGRDELRECCPHCHELIRGGERRCRRCGKALDDEDDRPWERREVLRDSEPHRGPTVLLLGILSIVIGAISLVGCPYLFVFGLGLGIPTWVMGQRDLTKMRLGLKDPRGQGQTQAGWICGIVGTILSILASIVAIFLTVIYGFLIFGIMSAAPPAGPAVTPPRSVPAPAPAPANPPKLLFEHGLFRASV